MSRAWLIGNALWMQAAWWACVLSERHPWLLLPVAAGLLVHVAACPRPREEATTLVCVAMAGCALDAGLGALGVFDFAQRPLPLWLAVLWLVLASGLRHSLTWARHPIWYGALLGMCGGPPAYIAGASLAGVGLPWGTLGTVLLLAPLWAVWMPLILRLAARR
ncbi:DUF2878 domain-containing protein [Pseudomonas sp. Sample_10]|uniref:DUF2878 domain-containing protein n=1 Tax=Pseudomonas sp. Sample_10 TaxID=2448269 RepID=UPI001036AFC2|nr:DUF2878 domain-containing protein [Pseudomonas sp. Sample_10]